MNKHIIMTNEEEVVEETTDEVETTEVEETEKVEDTTDWKAKAEELQGRLKRTETKLSKIKTEKTEAKPPSKSDLDYGKKAFLVASGIKGSKETELVEKVASDTGKTIEQVLESKYFQAELEEMRELNKTENAMPKGSKRTGQSSQDTVEYWIAKGELPTDRKLRQDVVNARIAKETNKSVFG